MDRFLIKAAFGSEAFIRGRRLFWSDCEHCTKNDIFFFQMLWKDDLFQKKIALEYDLSCIIRKDDIYFPRKYDIIF